MATDMRPGRTRILLGDQVSPERKPRRPWWFRPAVTLAVLVLLVVVGAILTRSGSGATGGRAAAPAAGATGRKAGSAASTAPIPVQSGPIDPGAGARVVNGVPVGYPRTQNGAVAATVNYELARSTASYFASTSTRHAVLRAVMASSALKQQLASEDSATRQFATAIGLSGANAGSLVARAAALGTRVTAYSPSAATVEVWVCGLVGITSTTSPLPVSASWSTYTLTVQWEDGDWKLVAVSSTAGPTPLQESSNTPSGVSDFDLANKEFHAPPYVG